MTIDSFLNEAQTSASCRASSSTAENAHSSRPRTAPSVVIRLPFGTASLAKSVASTATTDSTLSTSSSLVSFDAGDFACDVPALSSPVSNNDQSVPNIGYSELVDESGVVTFVCALCPFTAKFFFSMKKHMSLVHGGTLENRPISTVTTASTALPVLEDQVSAVQENILDTPASMSVTVKQEADSFPPASTHERNLKAAERDAPATLVRERKSFAVTKFEDISPERKPPVFDGDSTAVTGESSLPTSMSYKTISPATVTYERSFVDAPIFPTVSKNLPATLAAERQISNCVQSMHAPNRSQPSSVVNMINLLATWPYERHPYAAFPNGRLASAYKSNLTSTPATSAIARWPAIVASTAFPTQFRRISDQGADFAHNFFASRMKFRRSSAPPVARGTSSVTTPECRAAAVRCENRTTAAVDCGPCSAVVVTSEPGLEFSVERDRSGFARTTATIDNPLPTVEVSRNSYATVDGIVNSAEISSAVGNHCSTVSSVNSENTSTSASSAEHRGSPFNSHTAALLACFNLSMVGDSISEDHCMATVSESNSVSVCFLCLVHVRKNALARLSTYDLYKIFSRNDDFSLYAFL
jgi:hypothetical protein